MTIEELVNNVNDESITRVDLNSGEKLEFLDNGAMLISNINRKISPYIIYVGTISDHTLKIGKKHL